jgi:hypothetical protein
MILSLLLLPVIFLRHSFARLLIDEVLKVLAIRMLLPLRLAQEEGALWGRWAERGLFHELPVVFRSGRVLQQQ